MDPGSVTVTPLEDYRERLTPAIVAFLKKMIAERADQIVDAARAVEKHDNWNVHIIWDEEAPGLSGSRVYWVSVDSPVGIRYMIGSFDDCPDGGYTEETNVATFSFPGAPVRPKRSTRMKRRINDPKALLALIEQPRSGPPELGVMAQARR
ncbi:MAG: hypothetical protein JRN62_03060 [Nitrososphaerota archaeon]|jgi:hypothetical protein|nr:hypothetical protein [Nitrososphaerota archaeon]MDG6948973.1 hypothetical protein [Nitrososphaerota archaeon]